MPTLTVTDVVGAATADFTISGAGAAEDWTAYLARWQGSSIGSWVATATGTGNVTDNASITPGYYLAYASEDTGAWVADPSYVRLTGAATKSVFEQILDATAATLQGLTLPGITADNVVIRKRPWIRGQTLTESRVIVSPFPETRNHRAGGNETDETAYGALITVAIAGNQDLTAGLNDYLEIRQLITRAFVNQQLAGVVEVKRCELEPFVGPYPEGAFASNVDAQGLIVRAFADEERV